MTVDFASRYDELFFAAGALAPGTLVTVRLPGTATAADLWTTPGKTAAAANPVTVDAGGNLRFYADPGFYDLFANGSTLAGVPVGVNPDDAGVLSRTTPQAFLGDVRFRSTRPWRDVSAYATGGLGTSASPWTGWETAFSTLTGSTDLIAGANFRLYFPRGFYDLAATCQPTNSASHFEMFGDGKHASTVRWLGGNAAMFKFTNARNVKVTSMAIVGNSTGANRPTYGIQVHRAAGLVGSPGPTHVYLRDVYLGGASANMITTAVAFTADVGHDANNDISTLEEVEIGNCGTAYKFEHSNSVWHNIVRGSVSGCTTAFDNTPGAGHSIGGSFKVWGTAFGGVGTLLRLGRIVNSTHSISLYGVNGETVGKLIDTPAAITAGQVLKVTFYGGHIACTDPGAGDTVTWNVADASSILAFHDFSLASPTGTRIHHVTSGSTIRATGGYFVTAEWKYAGRVILDHLIEGAGAPTFTVLGGTGRMSFIGYRQHLAFEGTAPTVSPGGGVGAGGAAVLLSGSDTAGYLSITTGAVPAAATLATIAFGSTNGFRTAPVVVVTPADSDSAAEIDKVHIANITAAQWQLVARVALAAATNYQFAYHVIGG